MSHWTHVRGIVEVSPLGETQSEMTYFTETVLAHQPKVTGSERDMDVIKILRPGVNSFSNCDELHSFDKKYWLNTQTDYLLILDGDLRDREVKETYFELVQWLCRLAKRIKVKDVVVKITDGYSELKQIIEDNQFFSDMFQYPSWSLGGERNRTSNRFEYLIYERDPYSGLPLNIVACDYEDPEVIEELSRREEFRKTRFSKRSR